MRRGVGTFLVCAAVAILLAGCPASSVQTLPPGATPQPTAQSSSTGQASPPPGAVLYGVIRFDDHSSFSNPLGDPNGSGDDGVLITANVALARDPDSDADFIDAGSTYTARTEGHREVQIGVDPNTCMGVASWAGEVTNKKFSDPPTDPDDPGSSITAIYTPELNSFTLWADTSNAQVKSINACMAGTATTTTEWVSGPMGCGGFGLGGAVTVNPAGPDQIDMACTLPYTNGKAGSVTVSGVLTLNE